jgi:branched-chain amino acid transport system ATP-binding protein
MAKPKIILFDEPSLGLSPKVIDEVYQMITELNRNGSSILVVEQNVRKVLAVADYAYVLSLGKKKFEGKCETFAHDERLMKLYLGGQSDEFNK